MQYEGATNEGGKSVTIWDHFSRTYPGLSDNKKSTDTILPTRSLVNLYLKTYDYFINSLTAERTKMHNADVAIDFYHRYKVLPIISLFFINMHP